MTKSTNGGGGLSLSFTAKEDIQICIQSAVFTEYLITEHDFDPDTAAKVAEDFHTEKLILKNNGSRTRVQCRGDKIFNILRIPVKELEVLTTV